MDHKLEIFVTTAEQQSFTRAAELLHMTPSAISLSIKALEKKLGVRLFDRSNKYVQLTEAGQLSYAQAKEILLKYDQLKIALADLEPSTAMSLSIGAAYTFGEYFLPGIIYAFSKRHPHITPNITIHNSKTIIEQIHKQELDIGFIVEGEANGSEVDMALFAEEAMVVIARPNHPVIRNPHVDLDLLEAETWIIRESGSGTRDVTDKLFAQLGIAPKKVMSFGSSQTIKESVALGLGISYLSESTVKSETNLGTIGAISLTNFPNKSRFHYITHRSSFHTPAAQLFLDFLSSYVMDEKISAHTKKRLAGL
ncbi:LysR family transcriptional regulator [Planococcus sp. CP5-4]|uniref:LysR family transcriptional regulator n=1 Tax=unclassified Planococcus (in: firmicutes) TaxID=2662419 RepID=UPI001C24EB3B|nr:MULTISPECIES: LysR family transcriptional regulator [unclassified Planococcus (in: firmicutes)]MBU9671877.1 LysR family transcriptional regulator [Planococcus sp. CP5-4_YE]MBV0909197.1 LysR family transcriptional regulator [Planococcus sp. CP5-4_UN]MBW6063689.1 LysR family transcriptional regulator [Planococcus sp. CP5-4]